MDQEVSVLEAKSGVSKKTGKAWNMAVVRVGTSLLRLFSDVPLDRYIGQEITVRLSLSGGQDLSPRVGISEVV